MADVGVVLRRMRRDAGLLQHQLADRIGVARPTIARWERGINPIPLGKFMEFCRATGGDAAAVVAELMKETGER